MYELILLIARQHESSVSYGRKWEARSSRTYTRSEASL